MGWISDRAKWRVDWRQTQGPEVPKGRRTIAPSSFDHLYHGNMFRPDHVLLECGHYGLSWGGVRARCPLCKNGTP